MASLRALISIRRTLLLLAIPLAAGEAPPDLSGSWLAKLHHNGQTGSLALELKPDEKGVLGAFVSLPGIDAWNVPFGPALVEGNRLVIGSMSLEIGGKHLKGKVPPSLAPVHAIDLTLQRVESIDKPRPAESELPLKTPVWTVESGSPVWAGLTLDDTTLFVGTDDGKVLALEAATGRTKWQFTTKGSVRARPVRTGGSLLVHSDDGRLYRLDASSGKTEWIATLEESPAPRLVLGEEGFRYDHYASSPVVSGGSLFVGHGSRLHALDPATGTAGWVFEAGDLITSTPAVVKGRVCFGSFDGKVYALDAEGGELSWEKETGAAVTGSPSPAGDLLVVGSRSYDLFGLDVATGEAAWTFYYWFSWVESSARVFDGVAYVGSSDAQRLNAIEAHTGRRLWSFDTGGSAWGDPAVTRRHVFIGSVGVADYMVPHEGGFHAVDRKTGRGLWQYRVDRPEGKGVWGFGASPVAGGGRVYAAGLDGRIHMFEP